MSHPSKEERDKERLAKAEAERKRKLAEAGGRDRPSKPRPIITDTATGESRLGGLSKAERTQLERRGRAQAARRGGFRARTPEEIEAQIREDILKTEIEDKVLAEEVEERGLPTGERLPEVPEDLGRLQERPLEESVLSKSSLNSILTRNFPETSRVFGLDIFSDTINKAVTGEQTGSQAFKSFAQKALVQFGDVIDVGLDQVDIRLLGGDASAPRQVEDAVGNFDQTLIGLKEMVQAIRDSGDPDLMDDAILSMDKIISELDSIEEAWHGESQLNPVFARDNGIQVQADLIERRGFIVKVRARLIAAQNAANRRSIGLPRGIPEQL